MEDASNSNPTLEFEPNPRPRAERHLSLTQRHISTKNGESDQHYSTGSVFCSTTSAFPPPTLLLSPAYRTPICKAKRSGFKDTHADDLLAPVLKAVVEKTNVNPSEIGDIVIFALCFRFRKIVPCTNDVFNRIVRFINLHYGQVKMFEQAQKCLLPMGITPEFCSRCCSQGGREL
ncbi:hypothetical protein ACFX14_026118 [Malus domestica]